MRAALLLAEVLIVVVVGCHHVFGAPNIPSYIIAATSDTNRPQSDTQRDEYYKPAPVIVFAGVKPGMKVADYLIWDGYFPHLQQDRGAKGVCLYVLCIQEEDGVRPRTGQTVGADLSQFETFQRHPRFSKSVCHSGTHRHGVDWHELPRSSQPKPV